MMASCSKTPPLFNWVYLTRRFFRLAASCRLWDGQLIQASILISPLCDQKCQLQQPSPIINMLS